MIKTSDDAKRKLITGYSNLSVDLEIKDSEIEGKGMYSINAIRRGEVLFDIVAEKSHHHYDPYLASINPNWIGCGSEEWLMVGPGDLAMYLNHSCDPNVIINERLQLVAIKDVKPRTELYLDYSTTELDPYWSMECSCGAAACRKLLRSFPYLPEELRKKYKNFISPVFVHTAELLQQHQATVPAPEALAEK